MSRSVPRRRALLPIAAVTAFAAAGTTATLAWSGPGVEQASAISRPTPTPVVVEEVPVRVQPLSRSEERVRLEPKPPPPVVDREFTTAPLNVRTEPREKAKLVEVLDWAAPVRVTRREQGTWTGIVHQGELRWVHTAYLAEKKPRPEPEPEPEASAAAPAEAAPTGLSTAPCATGSDVEGGLVPNAVAVHRAVCAAFPQITSYGGVRADSGAHGTGQAVDIMVSGSTGDQIAEFVRANAGALGVSEVIWSQKIWTTDRSGEGWRYMEDRGSTTANHYDHVHVTVY